MAGNLVPTSLWIAKARLPSEAHDPQQKQSSLIGPRRFGKTSILKAAQNRLKEQDAIVLRFDATAFPTLELLVSRIVSDAAKALDGEVKWVGEQLASFFSMVRPDVKVSPGDGEWSVQFGIEREKCENPMFFIDALDGFERLATAQPANRPVGLIIDEFQRVIELGGETIEYQIRASIQQHSRVGYVFAGSKTRHAAGYGQQSFSTDSTRLGDTTYIGAIPREDFSPFLKEKFARPGHIANDVVVSRILDLAQDVPYNVQALASHCWYRLMDEETPGESSFTPEFVDETLNLVVRQQNPTHAGIWSQLTSIQQRTLMYVVARNGKGLTSAKVLREVGSWGQHHQTSPYLNGQFGDIEG